MKKVPLDKLDEGINEILKKRLGSSQKKTQNAITMATLVVRDYAIMGISRGKKTGKVYKRGSVTHQASKAGEMPATDTGFLVNQITTNVRTVNETVIGEIISSAPYSRHLEFGTFAMLNPKDGSDGGPRPFLRPSLRDNEKKIKQIFIREGVIR